jgi:hypothetical protein
MESKQPLIPLLATVAATVGAMVALFLALTPAGAAAAGSDYASCGNTTSKGLLIGDVLARRTTCKNAKSIARLVPARCGTAGTCTIRGYTCFTARAASELAFARCGKPRKNDELYHAIRFDFGS